MMGEAIQKSSGHFGVSEDLYPFPEGQIRPIPLGRKNWLFCWTELGAQYLGIIQSLLSTCRLQGIDPYDYLVDVLQRVSTHPAKEVAQLSPRLWKEQFAANPLRSDLYHIRKPA